MSYIHTEKIKVFKVFKNKHLTNLSYTYPTFISYVYKLPYINIYNVYKHLLLQGY